MPQPKLKSPDAITALCASDTYKSLDALKRNQVITQLQGTPNELMQTATAMLSLSGSAQEAAFIRDLVDWSPAPPSAPSNPKPEATVTEDPAH